MCICRLPGSGRLAQSAADRGTPAGNLGSVKYPAGFTALTGAAPQSGELLAGTRDWQALAAQLLRVLLRRSLAAGACLFNVGDPADDFFIVLSGTLLCEVPPPEHGCEAHTPPGGVPPGAPALPVRRIRRAVGLSYRLPGRRLALLDCALPTCAPARGSCAQTHAPVWIVCRCQQSSAGAGCAGRRACLALQRRCNSS